MIFSYLKPFRRPTETQKTWNQKASLYPSERQIFSKYFSLQNETIGHCSNFHFSKPVYVTQINSRSGSALFYKCQWRDFLPSYVQQRVCMLIPEIREPTF